MPTAADPFLLTCSVLHSNTTSVVLVVRGCSLRCWEGLKVYCLGWPRTCIHTPASVSQMLKDASGGTHLNGFLYRHLVSRICLRHQIPPIRASRSRTFHIFIFSLDKCYLSPMIKSGLHLHIFHHCLTPTGISEANIGPHI